MNGGSDPTSAPEELRDYLKQRLKLHGKVLGAYELDYAGSFIQHGGFAGLQKEGAIVQLSPDYFDVFDHIYRHIYYSAPPVKMNRKKPVLTDLRRSLALGQPVFVDTTHTAAKVGRNEPCPCGSGRKTRNAAENNADPSVTSSLIRALRRCPGSRDLFGPPPDD